MTTARTILPRLFLSAFLCIITSDILAKRPASHNDEACLSYKALKRIAWHSLRDLQSINPDITLSDVRAIIKSTGRCATYEEVNLALEQYTIELNAGTSADNNEDNTETESTNTAPSISGQPDSHVEEGAFYTFTPTANDPDFDSLVFSISNLPLWASFDTTTGAIYGTPTSSDIGLYKDIAITVSDGYATASLSEISIDVLGFTSEEPENPLLNKIGSYSISMGTSQDALNLQSTFNNGSDITHSADLSSADTYYFSIAAHDMDGNNILLSRNDIAGYRVYAGTSSDSLYPIADLTSEPDTIFKINGLDAGTYFLSISSYDAQGNESTLSNIARIQIM